MPAEPAVRCIPGRLVERKGRVGPSLVIPLRENNPCSHLRLNFEFGEGGARLSQIVQKIATLRGRYFVWYLLQ